MSTSNITTRGFPLSPKASRGPPLSPVPRSPTLYEEPTTLDRQAKENWDIAFGGGSNDIEKKPQAAEVTQLPPSKEAEPPITFPEGGLRAWLVGASPHTRR